MAELLGCGIGVDFDGDIVVAAVFPFSVAEGDPSVTSVEVEVVFGTPGTEVNEELGAPWI